MAAARARLCADLSAARRGDCRRRRRRHAGIGGAGDGGAGHAPCRQHRGDRRPAAPRRRTVLQSRGSHVRADGGSGAHDAADDRGAAAARHAGGRSQLARRDGCAVARPGRRAPRADQIGRPGTAARRVCRSDGSGQCGSNAQLFVAHADHGPRGRSARTASLHSRAAGPRLRRAAARRARGRRDSPGRGRHGIRVRPARARAPDRACSACRRRVRHAGRRRRAQRDRDDAHRRGAALVGAAFCPPHHRHPGDAAGGHGGHRRVRTVRLRRIQPDLGGFRRAVHRAGRGFRHPVLRLLSRQASSARRPAARVARSRLGSRRAARTRRRIDGGGLLRISADRLPRRIGTGPRRRHRHDRRVRDQHHAAARAAGAAASGRRARRRRLRGRGAHRSVPRAPPPRRSRRRRRDRRRQPHAAAEAPLRLQSAQPAQRASRIGGDVARPDAKHGHDAEHDRDSVPDAR